QQAAGAHRHRWRATGCRPQRHHRVQRAALRKHVQDRSAATKNQLNLHEPESAMFRNREEAARRLADKLQAWKGKNPLVLAIPRGAVPMAKIIADALGGSYDVALVRKLRAPFNPELAIGSVDESGWTYVAEHAAAAGADKAYIEAEKQQQLTVIRQRRAQYTPVRPPEKPAARIV